MENFWNALRPSKWPFCPNHRIRLVQVLLICRKGSPWTTWGTFPTNISSCRRIIYCDSRPLIWTCELHKFVAKCSPRVRIGVRYNKRNTYQTAVYSNFTYWRFPLRLSSWLETNCAASRYSHFIPELGRHQLTKLGITLLFHRKLRLMYYVALHINWMLQIT